MPSLIAWLDYSEDQRRRMREVIDLFREHGTLDELGIGSVRDTFAELLFPGLSTVQTRARYFLFIPWVYLRIERERIPSAQAEHRARHYQTQLVDSLVRGGMGAGDGVIGMDAREKLLRLPATVYWGGLGTFGIRRFSGSTADYHRSLDDFYRRLSLQTKSDGDELYERIPANWDPELPGPPSDLWQETNMDLTMEEASLLRDQIMILHPRSLLAHLVSPDRGLPDGAGYPWDIPADELEEPTRTWLNHARLFSTVMQGAAWAYNLMLARLAVARGRGGNYSDLAERYEAELEDWAAEVAALGPEVTGWDLSDFWSRLRKANSRIPPMTEAFCMAWIEAAQRDPFRVVTLPDDIERLIDQREVRLKRSQARLHNPRALELWSGDAGTRRLDYRWPVARRIAHDIIEGLAHV